MRRRQDRYKTSASARRDPMRPAAVLALLVGVGIAIGVLHNRLRAQKKTDPIIALSQSGAVPIQVASARTSNGLASWWAGMFHGKELETQNRRLQSELTLAQLEVERLKSVQAENARLRGLLPYVQNKVAPPLVAEVIAWLPTRLEQTITVGRGSRAGVSEGMAARTGVGLVGKVVEVGPFAAKVRLLIDTESKVGAVIARSKAYGILRGQEEQKKPYLELIYLDKNADVKVGDLVETSGHGGVFPPGIPIGTVESVTEDSTKLVKQARVKALAPQPGDLREVLLMPRLDANAALEGGE